LEVYDLPLHISGYIDRHGLRKRTGQRSVVSLEGSIRWQSPRILHIAHFSFAEKSSQSGIEGEHVVGVVELLLIGNQIEDFGEFS
jgi:hypothetical protein